MKKFFILLLSCLILTGCSLRQNTSKKSYNLNGYGKYSIPNNYLLRRDHSTSTKYFFVNKKDRTSSRPNNISVEGGINRYSKENHMQFRQAIQSQIYMQSKTLNATVNGSGITSKNGYNVYKFIVKGSETTIQYYIVGDYKYMLIHETIFDDNVSEVDNAAKYIVDSFIWE